MKSLEKIKYVEHPLLGERGSVASELEKVEVRYLEAINDLVEAVEELQDIHTTHSAHDSFMHENLMRVTNEPRYSIKELREKMQDKRGFHYGATGNDIVTKFLDYLEQESK